MAEKLSLMEKKQCISTLGIPAKQSSYTSTEEFTLSNRVICCFSILRAEATLQVSSELWTNFGLTCGPHDALVELQDDTA